MFSRSGAACGPEKLRPRSHGRQPLTPPGQRSRTSSDTPPWPSESSPPTARRGQDRPSRCTFREATAAWYNTTSNNVPATPPLGWAYGCLDLWRPRVDNLPVLVVHSGTTAYPLFEGVRFGIYLTREDARLLIRLPVRRRSASLRRPPLLNFASPLPPSLRHQVR